MSQNSQFAIETYTGRFVSIFDPKPEDIDIKDIAHAGHHQCRFSGHCRRHWSVVAHQLLVAHLCPLHAKRWAMLHDASEAYMLDLPAPVKKNESMHVFRELEDNLTAVIGQRFGLRLPMPPEVKIADKVAVAAEAKLLMHGIENWHDRLQFQDLNTTTAENYWLLRYRIPAVIVKRFYLHKFKELFPNVR